MTQNNHSSENSTSAKSSANEDNYQALVQQIADQVWKLWQKELKQLSERRGTQRGR